MAAQRSNPDAFSRLLDYPWHFLPITIVFAVRGYFINPGLFIFEQVLLYALIASLIVGGLFLVFRRFLRLHHAGLATTLIALLFFSYGYAYESLNHILQAFANDLLRIIIIYMPHIIIGLALLIVFLLFFQKREFRKLTTFLNVLAATMLIGIVYNEVALAAAASETSGTQLANPALENLTLPENPPESLPDVYYIILDGYPRADYLQSQFGIDNSAFIEALEDIGFFVADESVSNYTYTIASLGSSLSMDYIQNLASSDLYSTAIKSFLVDSRVSLTFQELGYKYVLINSGYLPYSATADLTIDVDATGELIFLDASSELPDLRRDYRQYLYRTTMLRLLDPTLARLQGSVNSWMSSERIAPQLEALAQIPEEQAPTFTLFHLTKPHLPVVFDSEGNQFYWIDHYQTLAEYQMNEEKHFADSLVYLNRRILETIEHILNTSPEPPIIVIQGDHGIQLPRNEIAAQRGNSPIAILNAYYFPDQNYQNLFSDITPINTFRLIFRQYFGMDYDLLPQTSYYQPFAAFISSVRLLEFEEIREGQLETPYSPPE